MLSGMNVQVGPRASYNRRRRWSASCMPMRSAGGPGMPHPCVRALVSSLSTRQSDLQILTVQLFIDSNLVHSLAER